MLTFCTACVVDFYSILMRFDLLLPHFMDPLNGSKLLKGGSRPKR